MKKELNGREIAEFVKERQAKAVRGLRQQWKIEPKLAIIRTNPDPVVDSYMKIKQGYGEDVLIDVDVHTIDQSEALSLIERLNKDETVHGIIVQIPLPDTSQTDDVLNAVSVEKDVDGLAQGSLFDAPTPVAINWLLAGYDVELDDKKLLIIGKGRLVGGPLVKMWENSGYTVTVADRKTEDLSPLTTQSDVIVSAAGVPGVIRADMISPGTVIVDAGVSTDAGELVGDVDRSVREIDDIIITPEKGGVGPLTVSALFENVIKSARNRTSKV